MQNLFKSGEAERLGNHGIDEIKIKGRIQYRFFGASIKGIYWILHGFIKKTQKIPKKEIDKAVTRKRIIKNL
ncbi:type II toxin-antitoxin system RelE/ParE family toxin [Patescibacteria group bacterium]